MSKETTHDQDSGLPSPEVGRAAHALIQKFKQVIREVREPAVALLDRYFSGNPQESLNDPISFRSRGYSYRIVYTRDGEWEKLQVEEMPVNPRREDWSSKIITLEAVQNREPSRKYIHGLIELTTFFKENERPPEVFTNTNTAIREVQNFLQKIS